MATIALLNYTGCNMPTNNLKIKFEQNNHHTDTEVLKNREIVIMRKKQKILPLMESKNNNNNNNSLLKNNNPAKKIKLITSDEYLNKTPPLAVARRNARERNRVKQVNNGFATLRQHIPEEIAEAYEAAGGRGAAKKLSKVETLRMAVEYIRNLEQLLDIESYDGSNNSDDCNMSLTSETSSNINHSNIDQYSASTDNSQFYENTILLSPDTEITTINGRQYIRIPGTNTFQMITTMFDENEENCPLNNEDITVIQQPFNNDPTQLNYFNSPLHIISPASVSPNSYISGQSLSPVHGHIDVKNDVYSVIQPLNQQIISYDGLITLKTEIKDEDVVLDEVAGLSDESVMEAISWFDQRQGCEDVN